MLLVYSSVSRYPYSNLKWNIDITGNINWQHNTYLRFSEAWGNRSVSICYIYLSRSRVTCWTELINFNLSDLFFTRDIYQELLASCWNSVRCVCWTYGSPYKNLSDKPVRENKTSFSRDSPTYVLSVLTVYNNATLLNKYYPIFNYWLFLLNFNADFNFRDRVYV